MLSLEPNQEDIKQLQQPQCGPAHTRAATARG